MEPATIAFLVFAGYPLLLDSYNYWFTDEPVAKECWTQTQKDPVVYQWLECKPNQEVKALPAKTLETKIG